jgi:phosphatidylglycerol:prolipoprotein diacylglycerol transferase
MFLSIPFPAIDPNLIEIGPLVIRWYSLAYIFGLILGWRLMRRLSRRVEKLVTLDDTDDFLIWATFGVILGGRLGYVLFYRLDYYLNDLMGILAVWQGGMSFHGGFAGVVIATILFTRKRKIPLLIFADILACVSPIGLFFGRLANFINGELFGRVSDVPWAMVFPRGGPAARHPSQLYEAALEGLVLFVILIILSRSRFAQDRPGLLTGVFILGYAAARATVELFREPDAHLGLLAAGTTMGQWLSMPMIALGIGLIIYAHKHSRQKNHERSV